MSDPFVGEIRMFAGNFAPRGWAFCDGQLLAVSQHDALFSLFGTLYGGDGMTTFGLPDLRGRVPIHDGTGPGLSPRPLGSRSGTERVTLTVNQLPGHDHGLKAAQLVANSNTPTGKMIASTQLVDAYAEDPDPQNMAASAVSSLGGSQAHDNMQPFLAIHFIVALEGIYPSHP